MYKFILLLLLLLFILLLLLITTVSIIVVSLWWCFFCKGVAMFVGVMVIDQQVANAVCLLFNTASILAGKLLLCSYVSQA